MPTVPKYDNFQSSPNTQPNVQFQPPTAPTPGAIAAEQASQFGKAALGAGDALGKIQMGMAQQVNETRVMDAVNKAKERMYDLTYNKDTGYSMQKGISALERPDGADLATEYSQKFQKDIDSIGAGLGNDVQKQAFTRAAGTMRTEMYGSAERHMSQEFTHFQGTTYDGTVVAGQRQIATNSRSTGDGNLIDQAALSIEAAVRAKVRLTGGSQIFADGEVRKAISKGHVMALKEALEKNDPSFAEGYLQKYSDQMEAHDVLEVSGHVTKDMNLRLGATAATQAVASVTPRMFNNATRAFDGMVGGPIDISKAFSALTGTESNNQQFDKSGKPLESTITRNGQKVEGAIGIAQVMRDTGPEAAKLAGLPWDENKWKNDPVYNAALGKAYFEDQIRTFGNLPQAYAAYNAGPGAVKDYRDGTNTTGKNPQKIKAADGIPPFAETQAYVQKNMDKYNSGGASMPTLMEVHALVTSALGPNAKPQVLAAAKQIATQQFEDLTKAKTASDEEALANGKKELMRVGGRVQDMSSNVRDAVPVQHYESLVSFGQKIALGDNVTDNALYQHLSTPGILTKYTDNQFAALTMRLNQDDTKHFAKQRATEMSGGGGNGFGDLNTSAITSATNARLQILKIDTTPKDGSTEAAALGGMTRTIRNSVADAQRLAGRKFTDVETAQHIDGMFAKDMPFRATVLGMVVPGRAVESQPIMIAKVGDIPSDVKASLKKDFANRGNFSPTDEDYVGAFVRFQTAPPKQKAAAGGATGSY